MSIKIKVPLQFATQSSKFFDNKKMISTLRLADSKHLKFSLENINVLKKSVEAISSYYNYNMLDKNQEVDLETVSQFMIDYSEVNNNNLVGFENGKSIKAVKLMPRNPK